MVGVSQRINPRIEGDVMRWIDLLAISQLQGIAGNYLQTSAFGWRYGGGLPCLGQPVNLIAERDRPSQSKGPRIDRS